MTAGYAPPQMMRVRAPGKKRKKPQPNLVIHLRIVDVSGIPLIDRKVRVYVRGATPWTCFAQVTTSELRSKRGRKS